MRSAMVQLILLTAIFFGLLPREGNWQMWQVVAPWYVAAEAVLAVAVVIVIKLRGREWWRLAIAILTPLAFAGLTELVALLPAGLDAAKVIPYAGVWITIVLVGIVGVCLLVIRFVPSDPDTEEW